MSEKPRRIDDPLWKSIIGQLGEDFLLFFYPDGRKIFDFKRGITFLDKEFNRLYPAGDLSKGVQFVDKLFKVFLLNGQMQYIVCHIEVQSDKGKGDLANRMFGYFYRIFDTHKVPILAIAILADANKNYHPIAYQQEFLDTRLLFEFKSYKILDQDEALLRKNKNPFAVVILTVLLALKKPRINDLDLQTVKFDLYQEMLKREMDTPHRQAIYDFIAQYVSFQDDKMYSVFEETIKTKIGRSSIMGTREYLLDKAKRRGIEIGREEVLEKMAEEKRAIGRALRAMNLTDAEIAQVTGLTLEELSKL